MNTLTGYALPVHLWINPEEVESGALAQIKNLANYPFAINSIAIMPDTHQGYGMPIGSVMATQEVIVPNAIGVDIGCISGDTEFLSGDGWKQIKDYNHGDFVLQYNKETDSANFVTPVNYVVKPCDKFYHFKNSKGLDQLLSEDHKVLVYKGFRSRGYSCVDMSIRELLGLGEKLNSNYYNFKTAFGLESNGLQLSDDEIRLDVMIAADGHIEYSSGENNRIYLHLKKDRKIVRSEKILKKLGIKFKKTDGVDGTTHLYFSVGKCFNKNLSKYWNASKKQLYVLATESLLWDGHKGYRSFFSSANKINADIVQFAFASNGIRAGITVNKSKRHKGWSDIYIVTPTQNALVGFTNTISQEPSADGKKYCFTVPSGYFVARRNGRIFITGNCGMVSVKTSIKNDEIDKEIVKKIFGGSKDNQGGIRSKIPVGFSRHSKLQDALYLPENDDYTNLIATQLVGARKQIGTLGGGNHFLELQRGSDGNVWVMIHSGSRNLGYSVANYYNNLAVDLNKKWRSIVPAEWDMAFLPLDSKEGKNYIKDMNYCIDFAIANRFLMMDRVKEAICEILPETQFDDIINKPHNFARIENHMGKNVWVHRKGATSARKDEVGMIPGSQGSKSYIVEGKGNIPSLESCSHGAGRRLSRTEATKTLNLNDEIATLDSMGVVHSIRNIRDLDESPSAYKDIEKVMDDQRELVSIITELTPIGVIKG